MFRRIKKKHNEAKKTRFKLFKKEKKDSNTPVYSISEENDYAVLKPFGIEKQKPKESKDVVLVKDPPKEEIKPKLIIQKTKPDVPVQPIIPKQPETPIKIEETTSRIPINHIETDIDKLMKIIDEKKVVDLDYLSKNLKINPDRLEAWAKMLEDHGLIEIEYPIIGLPKLRKKEWKTKE